MCILFSCRTHLQWNLSGLIRYCSSRRSCNLNWWRHFSLKFARDENNDPKKCPKATQGRMERWWPNSEDGSAFSRCQWNTSASQTDALWFRACSENSSIWLRSTPPAPREHSSGSNDKRRRPASSSFQLWCSNLWTPLECFHWGGRQNDRVSPQLSTSRKWQGMWLTRHGWGWQWQSKFRRSDALWLDWQSLQNLSNDQSKYLSGRSGLCASL